jgi:hypothetical protein
VNWLALAGLVVALGLITVVTCCALVVGCRFDREEGER